jgi:ribonuclease J
VIRAAEASGRRVCLLGRSMHRMSAAARSVGFLQDCKPFVNDQEANSFPKNKILYLCTGSQGEARAALSRIAEGNHPHISLGEGDSCVFSSRVIPGNEIPIRNLQNRLAGRGVRLYSDRDHPGIHVSGHPCRDELAQMYAWARPQIAVPTHGERRHLLEHLALAKELGAPQAIAPKNGDMVRLAPGRAEIIEEVVSGRLFLDGGVLTPENSDPLRERRHAAANGVLMVVVTLDKKNKLAADVEVRGIGLPGDDDYPLKDAFDDLAEDAEDAVANMVAEARSDDRSVQQAVGRSLKKTAQRIWERRPVVETVVVRL